MSTGKADYVSRIERNEEFVCAYKGQSLVGMFDVGVISAIYLSEVAR